MALELPNRRTDIVGLNPNNKWLQAVQENFWVMAFYNEEIQDDDVCIVLEEAKTSEYPELGLAWKCHQPLYNWYMFQTESTKTKLKTELQSVTLAKEANPVKMQDDIYQIWGKFTRAGLVCSDSDVNTAAIQALPVKYQLAISNASLKAEMQRRQLNLEILIQESRQMYEMRSLGKEMQQIWRRAMK